MTSENAELTFLPIQTPLHSFSSLPLSILASPLLYSSNTPIVTSGVFRLISPRNSM